MKFIERAQDATRQAVERVAERGNALRGAAEARLKKAQRAGTGVTEEDHKRAVSYCERGRKYYNAKQYEKAEQCFEKALDHEPLYALALYYRGLSLYKLDDSEGAVRLWERVKEVAPNSELASKAERKISNVNRRLRQVAAELFERVKPRD